LLFLPAGVQAESGRNSLTWKVADEEGVFGYIIYRAEQREGPFLRINARIIRKHAGPASKAGAGPYRFEDSAIEAGRTYYYFIDAVSVGGRKQRLSGVKARTAQAN